MLKSASGSIRSQTQNNSTGNESQDGTNYNQNRPPGLMSCKSTRCHGKPMPLSSQDRRGRSVWRPRNQVRWVTLAVATHRYAGLEPGELSNTAKHATNIMEMLQMTPFMFSDLMLLCYVASSGYTENAVKKYKITHSLIGLLINH